MDPDIPAPSIENNNDEPILPETSSFVPYRDTTESPLASSPASRTTFKTSLSHPTTPAPLRDTRSPSLNRNERRSASNLLPKRSSSSLSVTRGQMSSQAQLRRVSSNLNPASPTVSMKMSEKAPLDPWTAESVAKEYFERELEAHSKAQSDTIVFVHDSCYGHRFSRPRTSKTALSTIVERPERIHATLLGAASAYVRLGERHADGACGPHPDKDVKDLPNPPFLIQKTTRSLALSHPAVTHVHGSKWMEELQIMCDSAESRLALNGKELQRPIGYGKDEQGNNLPKLHEGDLYLCSESLNALQGCLGGICDAVDTVFSPSMTKRAFVCIRPPGHHCSANYPSGFCWLNNVHVGISYAAMHHGLTHAAIIDFDLHHGDGSQAVAWQHNQTAQSLPKSAAHHRKTPIGYYSLHDINSYPCEWGDEDKVRNASLCIENAHGQSVWNVHLQPWTSLDHFWQLYEERYSVLLEKTRSFLQQHSDRLRGSGLSPKAAIFISAGFDASQWEGQGMQRHGVNVPTEFYARFTADIVTIASQVDLGVDGRIISVLEGGYSDRALTSGVLSHLCGLSNHTSGIAPVHAHPRPFTNGPDVRAPVCDGPSPFDLSRWTTWWHESNLEALENRVAGNTPLAPKKKDKPTGNYSSHTQASAAKMTEAARDRRSLSAQLEGRLLAENYDRGPPPPVDWVTASYELSRIMIPSDRQTLSCRHDELNAEATKARRERQSAIGIAQPESRMQLRTRGKGGTAEHEAVRATSRTSTRRTTIAAVSELPDPSMPASRPRRRSSAASSIFSAFQDMKLDDESDINVAQAHGTSGSAAMPAPVSNLTIKKTRTTASTKQSGPRTNSPRKTKAAVQPANKVDTVREKPNVGKDRNLPEGSQLAPQTMKSGAGNTTDVPNVDDLTNGMKKISIKLKMPTPEQHAENQKKATEAKIKKPRTTRKPSGPQATKAKAVPTWPASDPVDRVTVVETSASNDHSMAPDSQLPSAPGQHVHDNRQRPRGLHDDRSVHTAPGQSSPDTAVLVPTPSEETVPGHGDPVVGSEPSATPGTTSVPDGMVTPPHVYQAGASSVHRTRADLPVFTSSSPIAFASEIPHVRDDTTRTAQTSSIWDRPTTAHR